MEHWLFYLLSLVVSVSLTFLISTILSRRCAGSPLPPGPCFIPILSLKRSSYDLQSLLRHLFKKHGPIMSLKLASRPAIFISDRTWVHQALIQQGATFADRLTFNPASHILRLGQMTISSAKYGPIWRALRRNLTAEILHPSRVRLYAPARKWVLSILIERLKEQMESDGSVVAIESFQFAMFCLLVLMCFGEKLDEAQIREIERAQKEVEISFMKLQVLRFC